MESILTSLSLPKNLEIKIKKLAKSRGQPKSKLIQEALFQYVQRQELEEIERKMQQKARQLGIESDEDVVEMIHELRKSKS
ncbi:MAG: ribbon-helix-helix protein, CopG family [Deltaproteobacteria bacterium]|nr:ribbon-helix-helix protein, CopG family [Deltaproteobacteria bacterium]